MELKRDGWYRADEGKYFVLTEKGKAEHASYKSKIVGKPVSEYSTEAVHWDIEKGYLIEVSNPEWMEKRGYEVVYNYKGYTLSAGNPIVFPEKSIAEKYMENYLKKPWFEHELYIRETIYRGEMLKPCKEYNGKQVYNKSWYYGIDALMIGDYVDQEIVDDLMDCLPPACMRSDCSQLGEPYDCKPDKAGNYRSTYSTFKKIDKNIWEYCGECFKGENVAA